MVDATPSPDSLARDYTALLARHHLNPAKPLTADEHSMRRAIDILWGGVGSLGISWIGFYLKCDGADEMSLACREPKPACSPIGLHGMCGRCWKERRPILVADVRTLGKDYIACDPRDQSELVIPMIGANGECLGVLDADSFDLGSFSEHDVAGMTDVLISLGLLTPPMRHLRTLHL